MKAERGEHASIYANTYLKRNVVNIIVFSNAEHFFELCCVLVLLSYKQNPKLSHLQKVDAVAAIFASVEQLENADNAAFEEVISYKFNIGVGCRNIRIFQWGTSVLEQISKHIGKLFKTAFYQIEMTSFGWLEQNANRIIL